MEEYHVLCTRLVHMPNKARRFKLYHWNHGIIHTFSRNRHEICIALKHFGSSFEEQISGHNQQQNTKEYM